MTETLPSEDALQAAEGEEKAASLTDEELTKKDRRRVVLKEARVGFTNGLILGSISCVAVGLFIHFFKEQPYSSSFAISGCIGISMVVAMTISSLSVALESFGRTIHPTCSAPRLSVSMATLATAGRIATGTSSSTNTVVFLQGLAFTNRRCIGLLFSCRSTGDIITKYDYFCNRSSGNASVNAPTRARDE